MAGTAIILQPGEVLTVVATNPAVHPSHPIMLPGMPGWGQGPGSGQNPVDPGYSPPWAQVPGGGGGGGGQPHPGWPTVPGWPGGSLPGGGSGFPGGPPYPDQGLPGSQPRPDQGLPPFPNHPIVIPPTEPPPVQPPTDGDDGNWVWAWSPQAGRWVWVKVPGEGEAGPKA